MEEVKEKIEKLAEEVKSIRRELNDLSHAVARVETKVEDMEKTLSWIIGLIAFFGSLISVLAFM